MDSPARKRLHITFRQLHEGIKFQLVNPHMQGAVPGTVVYCKKPPFTSSEGLQCNAIRISDSVGVSIRDDAEIEVAE